MTPAQSPIYVVGDVHGELGKLIHVLQTAGLIDGDALWTGGAAWAGGPATLWFLGDLVDRGPAGIAVIDLVRRLQREAAAAGGAVQVLAGNHELHLLAARRFGEAPAGDGRTFLELWRRYGGQPDDLAGLTAAHIAWISALPAMAHTADHLLIHADSTFYEYLGESVAGVNATFADLLAGDDVEAWARVLTQFGWRKEFLDSQEDGAARAAALLACYGGRRLVHGHTPISAVTEQPDATVTAPLIYAGGLCVNCDGGMYRGGPGFVYRLL